MRFLAAVFDMPKREVKPLTLFDRSTLLFIVVNIVVLNPVFL